MIALRLTIPFACWRKGHAREFFETEELPPPATAYGALLSLVGELDRTRHVGVRVTTGLFNQPELGEVLRSLWRVKNSRQPPGTGNNVKPDIQQLLTNADVVVFADSSRESQAPTLESRVRVAFDDPNSIDRFGGWSLGESTHLINDAKLLEQLPEVANVFLLGGRQDTTLPVWVDHVGSAGTRYAVGSLERTPSFPDPERLPVVEPPSA